MQIYFDVCELIDEAEKSNIEKEEGVRIDLVNESGPGGGNSQYYLSGEKTSILNALIRIWGESSEEVLSFYPELG